MKTDAAVLDLARGAGAPDGQQWLAELAEKNKLTPKGRRLAHYVAANPRLAAFASASEMAENTRMNPATVVRFAQALGFSGWPEFQLHFRHRYLGTLLPTGVLAEHSGENHASPLRAALERDVENLQQAILSVDEEVAERIARTVVGARRTLVVSSGSYAAVGDVFAHLATFMGYDMVLESHGGPHLVGQVGTLRPDDCLVAISFWRLNKQVVLATEHARRHEIPTVAITDSLFSPLARAAELTLVVPTESSSFFQSMAAPLSVVYGLLDRMRELGGDEVAETIVTAQELYGELDVLYT
jgi:DNA-binding MurR/RpiR family transcriptional regulator